MPKKQAVSRDDAIAYLANHPTFKPAKPLTEYKTEELRRRYNAFIKAEREGREISLQEARRGKAMTPEHPGRITHLKKEKKRPEQWKTGSKKKPPALEDIERLHKRGGENRYGEVTIIVHGMVLYEYPSGEEECREDWMGFSVQWRLVEEYMKESMDLYDLVYMLSGESHIRWCEIWEVHMLPAYASPLEGKKSA